MQALETLLLHGFDRHRQKSAAPVGLQQRGSVGPVRLVAAHIGPHMLGRQQLDLVTLGLERPRPVVGGGASLHHDPARRAVGEEPGEALPRQALALDQATLFVADGQLENSLCQVNGDGGSVHGRTPSARRMGSVRPSILAPSMPIRGGRSPSHHCRPTALTG